MGEPFRLTHPSHLLMSQSKKFILITGVSTGIGYGAVGYFLKRGYHVLGSVRSEKDQQRLTKDFPQDFTCLRFELTNTEEIASAVQEVATLLDGRLLTALVNNAGSTTPGPMQLLENEHFERQIQINLFGTRNVTNAFLPFLGAKSDRASDQTPGKIIMLSSISGVLNTPINGTYCVSKHAIESLGEVYRRELHMYGIDVISIQPGPIQSEIWNKNQNQMERFMDSDYGSMIKSAEDLIQEARGLAQSTDVISQLIEKIINSRRPRTAYIVNSRKWIVTALAHWLPARWVDFLIRRQFKPKS